MNANLCENCIDVHREEGAYFPMKRTAFLVLLCLCLILGACFATAGAEGVIEISTKEHLKALVDDVAADPNKYQGKTVKLLNDIDLGGAVWTPIAEFKGEFNGNGKTIKNITINAGDSQAGFFTLLSSPANVHDLTLQDVTANAAKGRFGTLAYRANDCTITNNHVKNVTVTVSNASAWAGGMFGVLSSNASNCSVENLKITAANGIMYTGGFAGIIDGYRNVENCSVKKVIFNVQNGQQPIGGFVGQTQINSAYGTFKNCHVSGIDFTISGSSDTLGVGGFVGVPGAFAYFENCNSRGKIDASGMTSDVVGGFVGNLGWGTTYTSNPFRMYTMNNCSADVDIVSGGALAGGFIASSHTQGGTKQGVFNNCKATGNVTNANGVAGGFAGDADRGDFTNCSASGLISGKTAGGFIGQVNDWKPSYDSGCNAAAFKQNLNHDANQIKLSGCKAVGTVIGTEKVGGLIGNVGKSLNGTAEEGAAGELIVTDCTAAPAVIGAKKSTQVAPYLNSTADSKTSKMDKLSGKRTTANPTDSSKALAMDQNGNVTIPEGGADVQHTDDPELKWIPAGSIIHRDGSITLPGEEPVDDDDDDDVSVIVPPKTGVDSADRFIPMALLSLLCMTALVTLRRKERRS